MKHGRILFLYGLTSSGKSTAAKRMKRMCSSVLYVSSNDIFHDMIAGKFFGRDFWGAVAETIGAQYYAVKGMAEAGFDVAVDGMLLDLPEYRARFGMSNLELLHSLLGPFDPLFVRFDCPLEELRRRNLLRGDRGEFQSEEQARLMTKDPPADLVIDAMTVFPDEAAARILEAAGLEYEKQTDPRDRAALVSEILRPLGSSETEAEDGGGDIRIAVRLPDWEKAEQAADELCRRGYRREEGDGGILLSRSAADFCRLLCD